MRTFEVLIPNRDFLGRTTGGQVEPEPAPTETVPVSEFVALVLPGHDIAHLGRATMLELMSEGGVKPVSRFFAALHDCFSRHLPFAIRPEVLWHLVATEVAEVVKNNPDRYRDLFTADATRQKITVYDDQLVRGDPTSDWSRTLGMFDAQMRETLPPGIAGHLVPGFTTHTAESRAAATVAFMDAASPYYEFWTDSRCGIPRIRLDGEATDYHGMVTAASALARVFHAHLGAYFADLIPVLKTLAAQADGAPADNGFWDSIYKFQSESGADRVSGWITAFLAHDREESGSTTLRTDRSLDWRRVVRAGYGGTPFGAFPTHVSSVPFYWKYGVETYRMTFFGGVIGIDNVDGFVTPRLSYGVAEPTHAP